MYMTLKIGKNFILKVNLGMAYVITKRVTLCETLCAQVTLYFFITQIVKYLMLLVLWKLLKNLILITLHGIKK